MIKIFAKCFIKAIMISVLFANVSYCATYQTVGPVSPGIYHSGINNYGVHNNIYSTNSVGRNYNIVPGSISVRSHQQIPVVPVQNSQIMTIPSNKIYGQNNSNVKKIYAAPIVSPVAIQTYPPYPQQYYNNVYPQTQVYTTTSTYYPVSTTYINNGNGVSGTITTERLFNSGWGNNPRRFLSW